MSNTRKDTFSLKAVILGTKRGGSVAARVGAGFSRFVQQFYGPDMVRLDLCDVDAITSGLPFRRHRVSRGSCQRNNPSCTMHGNFTSPNHKP